MESKFQISGFTCGSCAMLTQRRIEKIEGVKKAQVNMDGATTILSGREIGREEIQKILEDTHYSII